MSTPPFRRLPVPDFLAVAVAVALAVAAAVAGLVASHPAAAQVVEGPLAPVVPLEGTLERITVHGKALVGNLTGDDPNRPVSVYLPPGYGSDPDRRYPVVYVLHGFTDSDIYWFGWRPHFVNVPAAMERALDRNGTREMILVMPNAYTAFQGSMYSSSVTTGDWESFVAEDLVSWVDAHYRTVPERASRGLVGHSMGGYGAIRMAMKRPDVFSSVYVMSPCCMAPNLAPGGGAADEAAAIRELSDLRGASFGARAMMASAAAWSPNPDHPPLYLDLPVEDGEPRPEVVARQVANAILAMVPQYAANLRRLDGLAIDSGDRDGSITGATRRLGELLSLYGVEHGLEIYPGDHLSGVDERIEAHVLPFFSAHLDFTGTR